MSHVFISYSKKNRDYARKLADDLLVRGFNVWIDDHIDYGDSWERVIFKAIDDCAAFLVIMTPEAYESDWVLRECQYAERRKKPQYPILLSGEVFPRYGPTQYVDAANGNLPPDLFYDELDDDVPRLKEQSGQEVSAASQSTLIVSNPSSPTTAPETLAPMGMDQRGAFKPPRPTSAQSFLRRRGWLIGAVAVVTAAAALMIALNSPTNDQTLSTPTERVMPTATIAAATTNATAVSEILTDSQISFVSDRDGNFDIFIMNTDGSGVEPLVVNDDFDGDPTWSANGSELAFASYRDQNWEIYKMDADSETVQRLTNNSERDDYPSWSPDGTELIFTSAREGNLEIFKMDSNGEQFTNVSQNESEDYSPVWSPNGELIAFTSSRDGNEEIYVMNADGSDQHNLSQNEADDLFSRWSPDNTQLVFTSYRDDNGEIYIMDVEGGSLRNLSHNDADDSYPAWSPDGEWIAFASNRDGAGNMEIYVMDTNGENVRRLTDNPDEDIYPAWRP
ncbi:MAG: PD40 domain-containing protein [Burkholderiales bacterium]|nr:PD40 domain-containing protein [Anaerolineae bacterium]